MSQRRSRIIIVALCAALLVGLPGAIQVVHADTGINWTGAYYNNHFLQGSPIFTRIDPAVVFNWGPYSPGPGIGSTDWSARWTSVQYMNAGTYRFTITADDGVRAYIDGQIILDAWRDQAATTYYVNVQVVSGNHAFEIDYYQNLGDAMISVSWDYIQAQSTAWTAQYYNNRDLAGAPLITRFENSIDYFWGFGSPDPSIPPDNFSARWAATLPFQAATYRFTLAGDDGVRLFIDNLQVINQWHDEALTAYSIDVPLAAGLHTLRVEYYEATNQAAVRFNYQIAVGPPPYPGTQSDAWYGEYYANTSFQGSPSILRLEGQSGLNFNWTVTSPGAGFPRENFSVRWTRRVYFPGRPYTFYITADDGVRLYIDTTLILDAWRVQDVTTFRVPVDLTNGYHVLRLEYFQASGKAVAFMTWDPPDSQTPALLPGGAVPLPAPSGVIATVARADVLNVRYGPGINYDILGQVLRSRQFQVSARNADNTWVRITALSIVGWVNRYYVDITGDLFSVPVLSVAPPSSPSNLPQLTGVRAQLTSGLRVRTGPGTIYPQIDALEWGSIVDVVGRNSDSSWLQVSYGNTVGWILGGYNRIVSGSLLNVPITG